MGGRGDSFVRMLEPGDRIIVINENGKVLILNVPQPSLFSIYVRVPGQSDCELHRNMASRK